MGRSQVKVLGREARTTGKVKDFPREEEVKAHGASTLTPLAGDTRGGFIGVVR